MKNLTYWECIERRPDKVWEAFCEFLRPHMDELTLWEARLFSQVEADVAYKEQLAEMGGVELRKVGKEEYRKALMEMENGIANAFIKFLDEYF